MPVKQKLKVVSCDSCDVSFLKGKLPMHSMLDLCHVGKFVIEQKLKVVVVLQL